VSQSPINLFKPLGSYGWIYGDPTPFVDDQLDLQYVDLSGIWRPRWLGNRLYLDVTDPKTAKYRSFIKS
jgi:hypothetical protein